MALPAEPWRVQVVRRWEALEPAQRAQLSGAAPLRCCWRLLRPEDEALLRTLCGRRGAGKEAAAARFYRLAGNARFRRGDFVAAAALYSKAVSHAAPGGPELPLCFANRSAALFRLRHLQVCLEDIERALSQGYPAGLQPKVLLRKAECLLLLGQSRDAAEALSVVESRVAGDEGLMGAARHTLLSQIEQLRAQAREQESDPAPVSVALDEAWEGRVSLEENSHLPGASSSVSLSFDASRGRHLVAAQDILLGESLLSEEAFVSVLNPGEWVLPLDSVETTWDTSITNEDLYCHHCLKQLLASVPCRGCSYAKYCSQECAQLAWERYHRAECSLGALLLTLGVFCHVALRTVLVAGFAEVSRLVKQAYRNDQKFHTAETGRKYADEMPNSRSGSEGPCEKGESPIPGCDGRGQYQSSYQAVFHLVPHAEKHSPEHKFLCCLSIVALCKKLQEADLEATFLGQGSPESQHKGEVCETVSAELEILGEAMLRHMLQLQCNAQAVTGIQESGSGDGTVVNREQVRLATAFFPVLSLLNHSCNPSTSVTFSGTAVTVRASQPIPRGQEIFHCYGPHRCRMGAAERRQRLLSQYFFVCQCQACQEELGSDITCIPSTTDAFCCPHCQASMQGEDLLQCSTGACALAVSRDRLLGRLRDLQGRVRRALELLKDDKLEQAVELLLMCLMDAKCFLAPKHMLMGEIEDHLARGYASLGKWQEAARHLQSSIQVVEACHGSSSVEMGHELFKLAQILFNGFAVSEALSTIQRAEEVLSVHCGSGSAQVQELKEMKACLLELPRNLLPRTENP
ncbi:PREDICTED: SET and MYND domain-containing protein 4 isoform X1 [Gavialis gangeticus]|uniref:SET and MYND domain-containing protein 4 isoform X1 n=1 Tax=Gavialis gangeticus TaxID=94835 RepID=UPI00092F45C4|nr:PREDICTED: SET and MYND domain-containing protein 4 isoform X1 [Gavialis gangeticus]